jgi:hypothetical protein
VLRYSSTAALVAGAVLLCAAALPESSPVSDPDLYVSAGCSSCHGAGAAGAFGPTLAGTDLTFEAFLEQLRSPMGMMPPVALSLVSDEQARSLFDYVTGLEEPEGGPVAGTGHHGAGCENCPRHQGTAAGQGQGQGGGRGGACRHGACGGRAQGAN